MELHNQKTNIGDLLVKLMFKVGLDFFFEPSGPLSWLGVSICLGTVASFLPAWAVFDSDDRQPALRSQRRDDPKYCG